MVEGVDLLLEAPPPWRGRIKIFGASSEKGYSRASRSGDPPDPKCDACRATAVRVRPKVRICAETTLAPNQVSSPVAPARAASIASCPAFPGMCQPCSLRMSATAALPVEPFRRRAIPSPKLNWSNFKQSPVYRGWLFRLGVLGTRRFRLGDVNGKIWTAATCRPRCYSGA